MTPTTRLKLGAVFFTVFWTAGMLWWNEASEPAHIIIMSLGGALAGYLWYRTMRWAIPALR